MVQMPMGQEDVVRTREMDRTAADVERQAGRMYPEPGLVAGPRPALDPQISQP
jgi:hypothetical protein